MAENKETGTEDARGARIGTAVAKVFAGGITVRVAIAESQGRISPVFDNCRRFVIYDVDDDCYRATGAADLAGFTMAMRVGLLRAYGVSTLLCGAISELAKRSLTATGVSVEGFLCGDISQIMDAVVDGSFSRHSFAMPGSKGM